MDFDEIQESSRGVRVYFCFVIKFQFDGKAKIGDYSRFNYGECSCAIVNIFVDV